MRRDVAILCLVQFVDVLGVTTAITAIPAILSGLGAGPQAATPVATAYAMFFGGVLILGARLGDRFGSRRVLLAGLLAFSLVGLFGAVSTNIAEVVVARALQGASAAVSVPSALRLLLDVTSDPRARRTALAAWSAVGAAAGALGFIVGGAIVQFINWRMVFGINLPVGIALAAGVLWAVRPTNTRQKATIDYLGAVILIASLMSLVGGCSLLEDEASRRTGLVLLSFGGVLLVAFYFRLTTAVEPLIPRAAWSDSHLRTGAILSFANTASTSSSSVLATLYLQNVLGASALRAGFVLMSFSVAVIAGSAATRWTARIPSAYLSITGLLGIGAGIALLAITYPSVGLIVTGMAVSGAGIGIASVAATTIGTDVSAELSGTAAGIVNTSAQLGTALGTAAVVLIASISSSRLGWLTAAAIAVAAASWLTARLVIRRAHAGNEL